MEEINIQLYKLLKQEINDLNIGKSFNQDRIHKMRELCHLIMYYTYVVLSDSDIVKIMRFYD